MIHPRLISINEGTNAIVLPTGDAQGQEEEKPHRLFDYQVFFSKPVEEPTDEPIEDKPEIWWSTSETHPYHEGSKSKPQLGWVRVWDSPRGHKGPRPGH